MDRVLNTDRLILRNWCEDDREAFHRLNHDDKVMEFFPFRRSREEADRVMDEITEKYRLQGYSFGAMQHRAGGRCIGICGINPTDLIEACPAGTVEIGWRLLPEYQHEGYATEAAAGWMAHAFTELALPELVAFAVENNHASHRVMERIGMRPVPEWAFDHPKVPPTHPHLVRHSVHMITRNEWIKHQK